ncbi:hypothetical protein BP00DRAFT_432493 [Aspergillus indologenus CBS 114.80]|uniref:Uncharacterized protein n=1 Tax=Aspergillus indologenus CBS 114.80 TaxID=1450541 RepID=A0A2V5JBJ2_9EURO|nr:hypothetical protein BP00DRAFT_432493 [Aspergillus indologenus CBS 114.80]
MSFSTSIKNLDFDTVLELNLLEHHDDEEDLFYKSRLAAVANGDITPEQAATDIDVYMTLEAERLPKEIRAKLPLPEGGDETDVGIHCPNPGGHIEMLIHWVFKLCSAFPPGHIGQERIIGFLEALRALPKHRFITLSSSRDDDEEENMYTTLEVWPMGGNWLSLEMAARFEGDAERLRLPPTETDLRLRNFQSAIARITALDLIDSGWISSLETILPTHSWYPKGLNDDDSEDQQGLNNKDQGFRWLAGWVIASVQWLLRPEVGRYVYRQCTKRERITKRSDMWSAQRWQQWKEQFAYVAKEERVGIHAQELAGLALETMIRYEAGDACDL